MKVAAAQFSPKYGEIHDNTFAAIELINRAASEGARLIVLPELALTGYSIMSKAAAQDLEERQRQYLKTIQVVGETQNIAVVIGHISNEEWGLYNAQTFFDPEGGFSVTYYKQNLWGQDWLWAKPGRANPPIVNYEGRAIGLLICADVRDAHPDPWKGELYEKGDAEIVAYSANWGKGAFPATKWMWFVKDNDAALIVGNRYGKEANNDFGYGGVCVIEKDQTTHIEGLLWGEDCLVFADI